MAPEDFISRHITAALVAEGFPEQVAQGGQSMALITTAACLRRAGRAGHLMTACGVPVSGPMIRPQQQNGRQRKGREERGIKLNPACSDFVLHTYCWNKLLQEPFHEKT